MTAPHRLDPKAADETSHTGGQLLVARVNVYAPIYGMEPRLIPEIDLETLPLGTHLLYALPASKAGTAHLPKSSAQPLPTELQASFSKFIAWASEHLGQGYSLDFEDGSFTHPVTRWAHKAYCAGLADAASDTAS